MDDFNPSLGGSSSADSTVQHRSLNVQPSNYTLTWLREALLRGIPFTNWNDPLVVLE